MNALVGYTGFVGSNIYSEGTFQHVYNSKNIKEAYDTRPDLLIYAGLRAEKYLANNAPEKDMILIEEAKKNIINIKPKKLILISTVDVYKIPMNVNEDSVIITEDLHPYGYNRYLLEEWVRRNYSESLIIRLPGLFGMNIKKNFLYDIIHIIPKMLKSELYDKLISADASLNKYYEIQENGFYKCRTLDSIQEKELKAKMKNINFSAINFTDSRSVFQFYPLNRLWNDIEIALKNGIKIFNPATEPVSAKEIYYYLTGKDFDNELNGIPAFYNYHTKYAYLFGGKEKYIMTKEQVLQEIKKFVEVMRNEL